MRPHFVAAGMVLWVIAAAAARPAGSPAQRAAPDVRADALLQKAIDASGGEAALTRARVLRWTADATVHAGERQIHLSGRWEVEPPDRAVTATWEKDKGEASTRRLIIDASGGWMERNAQRTPMPPAMLAHERDQFYLYSIMRLVPLRDPGVRLSVSPASSATGPGLLVTRDGRPDVQVFFAANGRIARLRTRVTDPSSGRPVVEDLVTTGTIAANGVRWPRAIIITWDGKPYFDMVIKELEVSGV